MKIILFVFLLLPVFADGQIITTFAGCGSSCMGLGDGGPATSAQIPDPNQGDFDRYGNYFLASDLSGNRIRKVNTAGIISTVAGTGVGGFGGDGGPATTALLNGPAVVRLDSLGNLYISDYQNFRIRKVDKATGIITTIVGNGIGAYSGDGGPASAAQISGAQDICFDKFGNLYISEYDNNRIRKINAMGIITTYAGHGGFSSYGTGDGGPATGATFNLMTGIVADKAGNIYIGDMNAGTVRKIDTAGIITKIAGISGLGGYAYIGDGMPAIAAQFSPGWLAFDSSENLIIGDRGNERVYRIDHAGIFHCIAGIGGSGTFSGDGGPVSAASFDVGGLSFDPCWNLYITDIDNRRVRKVTFNPTCNLTSLGINEATINSEISIYPNPSYDLLHIDNLTSATAYYLQNVVGAEMQRGVLQAGNNRITVCELSAGMYVLVMVGDFLNQA